ncbi:cell envelope biogenesis protein TolA [Variovorax rhizosphaerae]|uniref:Cell envelope biogenesis protein TolA n=1 Tax=Variovorax rhizosphaerae TaxID=1836200 RepID=A0ABU8WDS5_9BURK
MKKVFAIMIAGLFAAGAYAQNPAGSSSQQQVITDSKPQQKAQEKADAKPQGQVKMPVGDSMNSANTNAVGRDKAAVAGQARAKKRHDRHPKRKAPKQGGTPK